MLELAENVFLLPGSEGLSLKQVCSNCFLVADGDEAVLIDSGNFLNERALTRFVAGKKIKFVLLTHGHFDHVGGVSCVNAKAFLSKEDLRDLSELNSFLPDFIVPKNVSAIDFNKIEFNNYCFRVIKTPGHTKGSVCFLEEKTGFLFSGDTLFAEGVCGRTDLLGGSEDEMNSSLKKLRALDWKLLCPGHGPVEARH